MAKSLARLAYDVQRKVAGRAKKIDKARAGLNGDFKSDHKRTKKSVPKPKKVFEGRGYPSGKAREADQQSIAQEIEGTGGVRPARIGDLFPGYDPRDYGLSFFTGTRLPDMTWKEYVKAHFWWRKVGPFYWQKGMKYNGGTIFGLPGP